MLLISIVAAITATMIGRRLVVRYGTWNAVLLGTASFVVIIAIAQLLLPDIDEVPEHFPAVILWRFRVASLGIELILWAILGLLFGAVAERLFSNRYRVARAALS
jgi:predicted cobalt transporter CbtA